MPEKALVSRPNFNVSGILMMRTANDPAAKNISPLSFYILPTVLGMTGGLLGGLQSGFGLINIGITSILGVAGFLIGSVLFNKQQAGVEDVNQVWREDERRKLDDINAYVMELERLFLQVVPILLRQVKTSRTHTEQEITVLTDRFAAMAGKLEQLISGTGRSGKGRSVDTLFGESREALTAVLKVLSQIQAVEHEVVDQVRKLSAHTQQLDSMATEVRKVAEQINLLALNAAIEAARAGENGRGFAVVADEVRKLAGFSSSTGERISRAISDINAAMTSTLRMSETSGSSDDKAIHDAEQAIRTALDDLRVALDVFKNDADLLRGNSAQIRDEIFTVLTAFQFQDRVSQMLSHVEHNLNGLQNAIDGVHGGGGRHADSLDVAKTLSNMELSYTMPEELINHAGTAASQHSTAKNDEITFF